MQRLPPTLPFRIAEPGCRNAGGAHYEALAGPKETGSPRRAVITAAFMRRRRRAKEGSTSDAPCLRRYMLSALPLRCTRIRGRRAYASTFCAPLRYTQIRGRHAYASRLRRSMQRASLTSARMGVQPNRSVTCRGLRRCRRSDAERPRPRSADATASRSSPTGAGFVSTTSKPACAILLRVASSS